jgi:hypothetical protein
MFFKCHISLTFYEMIHGSNFIMDNDIYSPRCYIERYRRIKCNENCVTHVKTSYKRFILRFRFDILLVKAAKI